MEMNITFPGGKKVSADFKGHKIITDQPVVSGGEGAAPSPFDLFLISIGTCAGFYILSFCQNRDIPTENISLKMTPIKNEETMLIGEINIDVILPEDFPEKYKKAVISSAKKCAVKKHMQTPPEFKFTIKGAGV